MTKEQTVTQQNQVFFKNWLTKLGLPIDDTFVNTTELHAIYEVNGENIDKLYSTFESSAQANGFVTIYGRAGFGTNGCEVMFSEIDDQYLNHNTVSYHHVLMRRNLTNGFFIFSIEQAIKKVRQDSILKVELWVDTEKPATKNNEQDEFTREYGRV